MNTNSPEDQDKREYVEAVPGPAIIISRETYEKMQKESSATERPPMTEAQKHFIASIKDETKTKDNGPELTL
jgi:hypothetical protein